MHSLLLAISFLTIVPVYGKRIAGEKEFANSLYFYPLVGFVLGIILVGVSRLTQILEPGLASEVLVILVWIFLTGALHLDGVMDSADGLLSGRDRERKLEIMKDSRIGAMGVITLAILILLKLAFLDNLLTADKIWVLLLAPATGRFMMVYAISRYPYARKVGGLGSAFGSEVGLSKLAIAGLILLVGGWLVYAWTALAALSITIGIGALAAEWMAKQLGGMTGDTFGALCEGSETIFIMTAVFLIH